MGGYFESQKSKNFSGGNLCLFEEGFIFVVHTPVTLGQYYNLCFFPVFFTVRSISVCTPVVREQNYLIYRGAIHKKGANHLGSKKKGANRVFLP